MGNANISDIEIEEELIAALSRVPGYLIMKRYVEIVGNKSIGTGFIYS